MYNQEKRTGVCLTCLAPALARARADINYISTMIELSDASIEREYNLHSNLLFCV